MRQLRYVQPSDDGAHLVLQASDGTERFLVELDAGLRAAAAGDPARAARPALAPLVVAPGANPAPAPAAPVTQPEVALGPRDIQIRIRAGESPQELALSLGVPVERVLRFAVPVVEERLRIADEARRGRARRPDGGENAVLIFGEAVDERFGAHGIAPADVTWDSRRRDDGEWVIVARWSGGAGEHTAEWLFHRASRAVTALDDTASDLLSDRPIRPIAAPAPPTLSAAPPLAPGVVAFPPMPDAVTGPLPQVEDVFDQHADPEGPRVVAPLVAALPGALRAGDPDRLGLEYDAPPLPLGITDPTTRPGAGSTHPLFGSAKRGESEDERAARARVPSWDDILLGVRRKQD